MLTSFISEEYLSSFVRPLPITLSNKPVSTASSLRTIYMKILTMEHTMSDWANDRILSLAIASGFVLVYPLCIMYLSLKIPHMVLKSTSLKSSTRALPYLIARSKFNLSL